MQTVEQPELLLLELARSGGLLSATPWLAPEQDRTSTNGFSATVMVVDDDRQSRVITARILRDEGYRVIEAQSGEQALEQLGEPNDVQLVLTDIAMPGGMDGLELARKISTLVPTLPVVLMSGYSQVFPQLHTTAAGLPLLLKPFTPDQLAHQIRDVLKAGLH